jgi:hypothetical protein
MKKFLRAVLVCQFIILFTQPAQGRVPPACGELISGDCRPVWYCLWQCYSQMMMDECVWNPDCNE